MKTHHRDTENTEDSQRFVRTRTPPDHSDYCSEFGLHVITNGSKAYSATCGLINTPSCCNEVDGYRSLIAEYPVMNQGLFAVADHESPKMRGLLYGTVVAQGTAGGRARNPEEVYENRVHPLSYRSLARF